MKHAIVSPLLSALVLPGLGQVINRQIIKGLALMGGVTVIFLGLIVKVFLDLSRVTGQLMTPELTMPADASAKFWVLIRQQNLTMVYVLMGLGLVLWIYGIVDAIIAGRRIDRAVEGE
jgi:TM2 domain-containing membrane protein YozV